MATPKKGRKKKDIKVTTGTLFVNTTKNNTLINLCDQDGNKLLG